MDTQTIVGATIAAAAGYFGAKLGANLDDNTSMGAGLGLAIVVAGGLQFQNNKKPGSTVNMDWEAKLADGGEAKNVERVPTMEQEEKNEGGCCGPAEPKNEALPEGAPHPLNNQDLKITKDGVVDFNQFCQLMEYCHKQSAIKLKEQTKQLTIQRREAGKEGNMGAFQQFVLQKNALSSQMDQKMIQTVFTKLGISQQVFQTTMQKYMSDPTTGQKVQQTIQKVKSIPQLSEEEAKNLKILPVEKLLEITQLQTEQQIQSITKILGSSNVGVTEQEKQLKMLTMQAQDEDALFEKTGVEPESFNYQIMKTELNKDPRFLQIVQGAQSKIQAIQQETMARQKMA